MNVMRLTIIDTDAGLGLVSFVAPWNALKALVAGCSTHPAPAGFVELIEAASKYDTGLKKYVFDNLAIFDENHADQDPAASALNPLLEKQLSELLETAYQFKRSQRPYVSAFGEIETEEGSADLLQTPAETTPEAETEVELTYEELGRIQREIAGRAAAYHPVFRVSDPTTRQKSQEPVGAGLVIFNLKAKRIIQVQNSLFPLQRSDRGRYHENGHPTERLYFYRLPSEWSIVP